MNSRRRMGRPPIEGHSLPHRQVRGVLCITGRMSLPVGRRLTLDAAGGACVGLDFAKTLVLNFRLPVGTDQVVEFASSSHERCDCFAQSGPYRVRRIAKVTPRFLNR